MSRAGSSKQSDSHEKVLPEQVSSDALDEAQQANEMPSVTQTHILSSSGQPISFTQKQLSPGSVIAGKYEIVSILGTGGMSVVYRARDRVIGRDVALKMLSSARMADEKSVRRFQQEGTAVGRLNHPNIVSVHDFGVLDTGEPFLVMDFAEGKTVADLLAFSGRFSPLRAMRLVENVLDALVHAHEKGVVHRDLKPGNIILATSSDGDESAKVFDFGIAKLMPQADSVGHDLTQTGEVFGSPLYMSPEQCLGKSLDGRSDIYSLGCIIFEAIAGHPPHQGETTVETIIKHVQEPAPLLSKICSGSAVPPALDNLVARALAKNPHDRYQDVREMRNAVSSLISDLTTGKEIGIEAAQVGKPTDRILHPQALTVFIFLSILIVGASLFWMIGSFEDKKTPMIRSDLSNDGLAGMVDEAKKQTEVKVAPQTFQPFHVHFGAVSFDHSDFVIDDAIAARLSNTRNFHELRLVESDIRLTKMGLNLIAKLPVQKVILRNAKFTPDFLTTICSIPSMRWIDLIEANDRELSALDMNIVAGCSDLTTLVVNRTIGSDDAMKPVEQLKKLQALLADECKITDKSLDFISRLPHLRVLSLNNIAFSPQALRKLSLLRALESLSLKGPQNKDASIEALAGCASLTELNLSNSSLTDTALMKLSSLRKLNKLEIVGCSRLTNAGIRRFQAKLPQCLINRSIQNEPIVTY